MNTYSYRRIAIVIAFQALTLAVISPLHLSGVLGEGAKPFNPTAAGTAEAVIGLVLVVGTLALLAATAYRREVALAATGFATIGFIVGLSFTLRGGDTIDIAYHATILPLLLITLTALVRTRPAPTPSPSSAACLS